MPPGADKHPDARAGWLDCFTKLTNRELRSLYGFGFASVVQLEIALFILAQTRGTGRIMAGELSDADWREWEAARDTYGREAAPLYRGVIAGAIGRNDKQVARELRRLIAAGIVIEHESGRKGRPAVLSVDLDATHWRRALLSGASALPKVPHETRRPRTSGNSNAPESPGFGSAGAPLFKRPSERDLKSETRDSGESRRVDPSEFTVPEIRDLARRLEPSRDPAASGKDAP